MQKSALTYSEYDFKRRGDHSSTAKDRPAFEVDKGRIIHSAAFRRLQGKTQVLGVGERDFYRTRLTHSLEVAQLGRGLCRELEGEIWPDPDLVEAICLAHDIGHPPFGHSGEKCLNARVKDEHGGGFGANPQNLRIVAVLEAKYANAGLDLTRATLDGLVKYPELYDPDKDQGSKFTYASDQELLNWIKEGIQNVHSVPLEGQLADWADQMAYSVNDIEDVVRAGLLTFTDMSARAGDISKEAQKQYAKARKNRGDEEAVFPKITTPEAIEMLAHDFEEKFARPKLLRDRKINLKKWTSETFKSLKAGCQIKKLDNGEISARYQYRLEVPREADALAVVLKSTAQVLVFKDPRVTTLEAKGRYIIEALFDTFSKQPDLLPLDFRELIQQPDTFGSKERLVADFVAGMTDRYAFVYYKRLFHPGAGSFYEDV